MRQLRGNRIAMIFQDPMMTLNPVLRIDVQMVETILAHEKVARSAALERSRATLVKVGIPSPDERLQAYPHQFSGGMRQRVAIAIALLNNPDLIIADEPTTALDVTIQGQILFEMQKLTRETGAAMIWITHDLSVVAGLADRVCVMYAGKIVEQGTTFDVLTHPWHPYTQGLLDSVPARSARGARLAQIPGMTPSVLDLPPGCAFRERCPYATEECAVNPAMRDPGRRRPRRALLPSAASPRPDRSSADAMAAQPPRDSRRAARRPATADGMIAAAIRAQDAAPLAGGGSAVRVACSAHQPGSSTTRCAGTAMLALAAGRPEVALQCRASTRPLTPHPASAIAQNLLGVACRQNGRLADAIACAAPTRSRSIPSSLDARKSTSATRCSTPAIRRRRCRATSKALALDPRAASVHNNLGNLYRELRRPTDAIAAYRRALELDPQPRVGARESRQHAQGSRRHRRARIAAFRRSLATRAERAGRLEQSAADAQLPRPGHAGGDRRRAPCVRRAFRAPAAAAAAAPRNRGDRDGCASVMSPRIFASTRSPRSSSRCSTRTTRRHSKCSATTTSRAATR